MSIRPLLTVWLLSASALLLVGGCALREKDFTSSSCIIAAEGYLKESQRKHLPSDKRIGFLLAAAHASWNELTEGETSDLAQRVYNTSIAALTLALRMSPGRWDATTTIEGPKDRYRISFATEGRREGIWNPAFFDKILMPAVREQKSFGSSPSLEGLGGVLVGVHKPEAPRQWFLPRVGVSAPVTAIADFAETPKDAAVNVKLTLYDPTKRDRVSVGDRTRRLAANFAAPLASYPNPWLLEYAALINPIRYADREGLYFVQPYDPEKIPVVLVHGLMSIPQMWLPIIAQIERNPELRGKFQFWTYAYATGDSVALAAMHLRESLRKVYQVYPKTKSMVMVSYSLGGLLGKMQVQTTGDVLWREIFKDDAARLQAELPGDSLFKRALVFEANPRIKRIVFICTPHLGSPLAIGPLGQLGRSVILLPIHVLQGAGNLAGRSLAAAVGKRDLFVPNSIWGLSPKSPLLIGLYKIPVQPPFHSIIGNRGLDQIPLQDSSDGVVPYSSSHLAGAISERIVPAQHVTACQNPESIEELKRILLVHLRATRD